MYDGFGFYQNIQLYTDWDEANVGNGLSGRWEDSHWIVMRDYVNFFVTETVLKTTICKTVRKLWALWQRLTSAACSKRSGRFLAAERTAPRRRWGDLSAAPHCPYYWSEPRWTTPERTATETPARKMLWKENNEKYSISYTEE